MHGAVGPTPLQRDQSGAEATPKQKKNGIDQFREAHFHQNRSNVQREGSYHASKWLPWRAAALGPADTKSGGKSNKKLGRISKTPLAFLTLNKNRGLQEGAGWAASKPRPRGIPWGSPRGDPPGEGQR